jgi:maltoporin
MRRLVQISGLLVTGLLSAPVFAQDPADSDGPEHATELKADASNKASDEGTKSDKAAEEAQKAAPEPAAPAPAPASAAPVAAPEAKPKLGDTSIHGYFRGGFGASSLKGRQVCFSLAKPGGVVSKYRLGNECEVWAESEFTTVAYADDDGMVARMHFMPTVYLPSSVNGYSPTGVVNSPALYTTSTGATIAFPNLYLDMKGIPWLFGGTAWAGTRYYKRESVYISDFFYWNPSGVGGGVEDVELSKDLRFSYGVFAVDGEPAAPATNTSPLLPLQVDFGFRNDFQLRGIKFWDSGEFQVGFQYIADYSNHLDENGASITHSGWGATVQFVQKLLGGDNKLAFQYGRGGGTGFGTLARFYYPDFSLYHTSAESRFRIVDVLTVQPMEIIGGQVGLVYQHDDLGGGGQKQDWYSAGARATLGLTKYAKTIAEVGYDQVTKNNGNTELKQWLAKATWVPIALTAGPGFWTRPELRLFYTWATWNEDARTATVDSGFVYTATQYLSGATFGLQGETTW